MYFLCLFQVILDRFGTDLRCSAVCDLSDKHHFIIANFDVSCCCNDYPTDIRGLTLSV